MKYHIRTRRTNAEILVEKNLFNSLSIIATFVENGTAQTELEIYLNYGHLEIYPIIQQRIFEIKFDNHKAGLRNLNKLSSTEYFQ